MRIFKRTWTDKRGNKRRSAYYSLEAWVKGTRYVRSTRCRERANARAWASRFIAGVEAEAEGVTPERPDTASALAHLLPSA